MTGFRREESEFLLWSSVDLKYGHITSINPKNGGPHTLSMGDFLLELMQKRYSQATTKWVFPSAKSSSGHLVNISKIRQKIDKSCGVEFSFHDLRRTFRSIAENLDYARYTIKRLLNHKEVDNQDATAAGYVQVTERKLSEAMYAIEDIVLGEYKAANCNKKKYT